MSKNVFNLKSISINGIDISEIITNKYEISQDNDRAKKQIVTGAVIMDLINGVATNCLLNDFYPNVDEKIYKTENSITHANPQININCYNNDYFLASKNRQKGPIYFNADVIKFTNCGGVIIYISESFEMFNSEVVYLSGITLSQIKTSNKKIKIEIEGDNIKLSKV